MSDVIETKAKKIAADQVEVLGANGEHIAGKEQANPFGFQQAGGFKVVKMGPLGGLVGLVMLPILIPVAIIGFFGLMLLAMVFGKTIFKTGMMKVMKR
jgi:hypothetical protein